MDYVWETLASVGLPVAGVVLVAFVAALLPETWRAWGHRWRGVLGAGGLLLVAVVAVAMGVAILVATDHLGAETPEDAFVVGPVLIAGGLLCMGLAMVVYRNHPLR